MSHSDNCALDRFSSLERQTMAVFLYIDPSFAATGRVELWIIYMTE